MRYYVAGGTRELLDVQQVQELIRRSGHEVTFDWTGPEGEIRTEWTSSPEVQARGSLVSQKERIACLDCDTLVLVCPRAGGLGCFIEFGIAAGAYKSIIVLQQEDKDRQSVFFCLPGVTVVRSLKELSELIPKWSE